MSGKIRLVKELNGRILDIGGGGEGIIGRLYQDQVTNQKQAIREAVRVLKAGGEVHIWDCDIASAYPHPFCTDVEIDLPDEHVSTTYGVGKLGSQDSDSISEMCMDVGMKRVIHQVEKEYFYMSFVK